MAPRTGIAVREIVYQLSPYQQSIIGQAFKNAPSTFIHFVKERAPGYVILAATYFGGTLWCKNEMEKEKMHERF
eukprot:CAMPEP_0202902094 /NCGR_PEP_ID=MMETSP1392-20130828/16333_1 /ASSEMBLY_ACC=CAM_ASM_000868 /TAXON_ID=225041 /ORGANISM="Chlamydomonas chlamydogama, Strain SAG 11-48b" /LENGTH=73 /DNA_ID=CAMNT_0049588797 /DNA_START=45 /DNA_END=266 /DNA_ORIENTATION=-